MPDRQLWKFGGGLRVTDLLLKLLVILVAFQIFYGSFVALFALLAGHVGGGVPRWIDGVILGLGFVSAGCGHSLHVSRDMAWARRRRAQQRLHRGSLRLRVSRERKVDGQSSSDSSKRVLVP